MRIPEDKHHQTAELGGVRPREETVCAKNLRTLRKSSSKNRILLEDIPQSTVDLMQRAGKNLSHRKDPRKKRGNREI
jgi:hypothetical protein